MACEPRYTGTFVNVYLTDRAYGGSEEGGWWYDCGEAISSEQYATDDEADQALTEKRRWCEEENADRRSDINSVLSEGRYVVCLEPEPAQDYPQTRPHYE